MTQQQQVPQAIGEAPNPNVDPLLLLAHLQPEDLNVPPPAEQGWNIIYPPAAAPHARVANRRPPALGGQHEQAGINHWLGR